MKRAPAWISKRAVLAIHERLLAEHGGASGLLSEGSLEAALAGPQNLFAYEGADIPRLAAAYAHALTRNHPFADGNKRVAFTVAGVFLELNGLRLEASEQDAARAVEALSSHEIDELQFATWLRETASVIRPPRRTASPRSRVPRRKTSKKK